MYTRFFKKTVEKHGWTAVVLGVNAACLLKYQAMVENGTVDPKKAYFVPSQYYYLLNYSAVRSPQEAKEWREKHTLSLKK